MQTSAKTATMAMAAAAETRLDVMRQIRFYSAPLEMAIPPAKEKYVPHSGTYPKGFRVSGTHVGVKKSNTRFPDLALISSDTPSSAAAVFTTNKFKAAPVQVSKETLNKTGGNRNRIGITFWGLTDFPVRDKIKKILREFNFIFFFF